MASLGAGYQREDGWDLLSYYIILINYRRLMYYVQFEWADSIRLNTHIIEDHSRCSATSISRFVMASCRGQWSLAGGKSGGLGRTSLSAF